MLQKEVLQMNQLRWYVNEESGSWVLQFRFLLNSPSDWEAGIEWSEWEKVPVEFKRLAEQECGDLALHDK